MKTCTTPERLRAAAWLLGPLKKGYSEFICSAFRQALRADGLVNSEKAAAELEDLMEACGIESLEGNLFLFSGRSWSAYYEANAEPVRFMFLHFMALYLEGEPQ